MVDKSNQKCVYVISSPYMEKGLYKIGSHTGSKEKLLTRYCTALIEPHIEYIYFSPESLQIEKEAHTILQNYRIVTSTGKLREWFKCPIDIIQDVIKSVINKREQWWFFFDNKWEKLTIQEISQKSGYAISSIDYQTFRDQYLHPGSDPIPTSPPNFTVINGKPVYINKNTGDIIDASRSSHTYQCDEEIIDILVKLIKKHNISADILRSKLGKDKQ